MYTIVIHRFMSVRLANSCYEAAIKADTLGIFTYISVNGNLERMTSFLVQGMIHLGEIASFSSHYR